MRGSEKVSGGKGGVELGYMKLLAYLMTIEFVIFRLESAAS